MNEAIGHQDAAGLFCPECGYDLRMSEARCPECGRPFDRMQLKVSQIPWVHRKQIGRVRAWFKTAWMVLRRPGALGDEVARPVEWIDARRFSRVTIGIVTLFAGILASLAYERLDLMDSSPGPGLADWQYPIFALWRGPWIIPVLMAITLLGGMAVQWWMRVWFWWFGGSLRARASALACYGSIWLMPLLFVVALIVAATAYDGEITKLIGGPNLFLGMTCIMAGAAMLIFVWGGLVCVFCSATNSGLVGMGLTSLAVPVGSAVVFGVVAMSVNYAAGLLGIMLHLLFK